MKSTILVIYKLSSLKLNIDLYLGISRHFCLAHFSLGGYPPSRDFVQSFQHFASIPFLLEVNTSLLCAHSFFAITPLHLSDCLCLKIILLHISFKTATENREFGLERIIRFGFRSLPDVIVSFNCAIVWQANKGFEQLSTVVLRIKPKRMVMIEFSYHVGLFLESLKLCFNQVS